MRELHEAIPDSDALLALEPEELGAKLLFLLRERIAREGEYGGQMIRRAFHKDNGPLREPRQEEAEREALMHLFAGAVGSYKNPHSHRNVAMENAGEAIEIVMLASHLLRIVNARRLSRQEREPDEA